MSGRVAVRVALGILVVSGLFVGVWAAVAPHSFFVDFPGGGHVWAGVDGPYNEHLVRDVGDLNLALVVVTAAACVWLTRTLTVAAALAWLVYSVPHFVYHALNLSVVASGDQVPELVSLAFPILLSTFVIVMTRPGAIGTGPPEREPSTGDRRSPEPTSGG